MWLTGLNSTVLNSKDSQTYSLSIEIPSDTIWLTEGGMAAFRLSLKSFKEYFVVMKSSLSVHIFIRLDTVNAFLCIGETVLFLV